MSLLANLALAKPAANLATLLFSLFIGAQLLLAAGILPVTIFWGGRQTALTPGLRMAGVVAAVMLGVFIYVIRYRAGLLGVAPPPSGIRIAAWVITAFMVLNSLGNFASVSSVERFLFGPLTVLLAVSCLLVAASDGG